MKEYVFAKIDFDTAEKVPCKVRTRKYNRLTGNTFLGYNGINPFIRNEYAGIPRWDKALGEIPELTTQRGVRGCRGGRDAHASADQRVAWAANKRFEISKFKFKFPRARTYEFIRARSRLYRSKQASKQVRSVPSKKKEKGPRQTARN